MREISEARHDSTNVKGTVRRQRSERFIRCLRSDSDKDRETQNLSTRWNKSEGSCFISLSRCRSDHVLAVDELEKGGKCQSFDIAVIFRGGSTGHEPRTLSAATDPASLLDVIAGEEDQTSDLTMDSLRYPSNTESRFATVPVGWLIALVRFSLLIEKRCICPDGYKTTQKTRPFAQSI